MPYQFEFDTHTWIIENVKFDFLTHSESFLQRNAKGYEKPFHSHVYYELLFSASDGSAELFYDNQRRLLKQNDFVITAPYYTHRAAILDEESLLSFGFLFRLHDKKEASSQDLFRRLQNNVAGHNCIIGNGGKELGRICRQLREFSAATNVLDESSLVASFLLMLFRILRNLETEGLGERVLYVEPKDASSEKAARSRIPGEIASTINNLLSDSFTTDVTPEDIAASYYVSPKQVNRYIHNQYGKTFMQRKTQLRMDYAGQLLRESNLSIEAISEKVGYHSINSFYSAFKVYFGITPHSYRVGKEPIR